MSVEEVENIELTKENSVIQPRMNEYIQKVLGNLLDEKERLSEDFPLCKVLIDEAIDRILSAGHIPGKEFYADVLNQKPLKVAQKVFVPAKQYPKFNFIGKILGPKGNSLRRLQEETQCKIAIKGRNSTRDNAKEEELRNSGELKYAHFNKDLYLEISTVAPPAESYARIAYALEELRKYIIPDKNDEVSQEQLLEMMEINPDSTKIVQSHAYKSVLDRRTSGGANESAKYSNFMKKMEHHSEKGQTIYEHDGRETVTQEYPKQYARPQPQTNEYFKVRPNIYTQKRYPPTAYGTEIKRTRAAPSNPYGPNPFGMFKKYQ